ncbi:MAG: hypothetical protein ACKOF7_03640 [Phycisphaerales bacterium]
MTNIRISTGTGLALLAGAITLHAVLPYASAHIEPSADAAWTPVFTPVPAPQASPGAPAAQQPQPIALAAVPTASSGNGVVVMRMWANGNIDRRLVNSAVGLTYQNGWQPLVTQP